MIIWQKYLRVLTDWKTWLLEWLCNMASASVPIGLHPVGSGVQKNWNAKAKLKMSSLHLTSSTLHLYLFACFYLGSPDLSTFTSVHPKKSLSVSTLPQFFQVQKKGVRYPQCLNDLWFYIYLTYIGRIEKFDSNCNCNHILSGDFNNKIMNLLPKVYQHETLLFLYCFCVKSNLFCDAYLS